MSPDAKEEGVSYSQARQQTHFHNPNIQSGNQQVSVSSNIAPITGTYRGLISRPRLTTSPVVLRIIITITVVCFVLGMFFGNLGEWHQGLLGPLGIFFIIFGIVPMLFVAYQRFHRRTVPVNSVAASVAGTETLDGTMHPNTSRPTVTLQQGFPNPSQAGGTTSCVLETRGMQSGWVAMGREGYNTQLPGYPVGNRTAQLTPTQNFPGTPYHPPPNGTLQYPQPPPTNPSAAPMTYLSTGATPQVNYPVMHPPPTADTRLGMTSPVSEEHGLPPPPSYNDVFSSS